jgi:hypothetical protein
MSMPRISVAAYRASHEGWTTSALSCRRCADATLTDVCTRCVDEAVPNSIACLPDAASW